MERNFQSTSGHRNIRGNRMAAKVRPESGVHKQKSASLRQTVINSPKVIGSAHPTTSSTALLPVEELAGRLESLFNRAQELDMLTALPHTSSQAERMLTSEIREFLPTVEGALDNGSAQYIVRLSSLYDLAYRLGYKRATSKELLPRLFTRAITLWLKGDKSVGEEDLIAMLQHIDPRYVDFKYIDWSISVQDKWIRELEANNGCFPESTPPTLARKRLQILLHANLWTYFGDKEEEVKRRWRDANHNNYG